MQNQGKK